MKIKFISWNVNGIRALYKKPEWNWLNETKGDIIGLQETKANPAQLPEEIINWKNYYSYWDSSIVRKGYSGVAAYTRFEPLKVTAQLPEPEWQGEGRLLHLEFQDFHFFTGYFPNGGAPELDEDGVFTGNFKRVPYKMGFLNAFLNLAKECEKTKPVIVCGDFNIAAENIDLAKPKENENFTGFLPIERQWIQEFKKAGFIDSFRHIHGDLVNQYTWWSYQNFARRKNNGWRIDYFFVSEKLADKITDALIYSDVKGSDHCPIGVEIDF